jgi:hypothetical protein
VNPSLERVAGISDSWVASGGVEAGMVNVEQRRHGWGDLKVLFLMLGKGPVILGSC